MTANELADAIEKGGKDGFYQDEIIAILRQQQAEIERLQRLCESYIRSDYEGTSMFEPFMEELYGKAQDESFDRTASHMAGEYISYKKELTDEEIESAYWSLVGKQYEGKIASYLYNFARDILKKVREK